MMRTSTSTPVRCFLVVVVSFYVAQAQAQSEAFGYKLVAAGDVSVTDNKTKIGDLKVLFNGDTVQVIVGGLEWEEDEPSNNNTDATMHWKTGVNGVVLSTGSYDIRTFGRRLPDSLDCGQLSVNKSGSHTVFVHFSGPLTREQPVTTERNYQSYEARVSILPLLTVLILAVTTRKVEFSFFCTIFIGACMVSGSIKDGFKSALETYILESLHDIDHCYVFLFVLFLSGLVGMIQKSGGLIGFQQWMSQYANTPRSVQLSAFCVTSLCFFDDYASLLLAGQSMSPLSERMMVSKEKLTFIVDASAANLASLAPASTWVGFQIGLIQEELDKLIVIYGKDNLTISTSSISIFIQSMRYRFYPIFMLVMILSLICFQRDFGPMLFAERRARLQKYPGGGNGRPEQGDTSSSNLTRNSPRVGTPYRAFNMLVPVVLLIFFIIFLLIRTGEDGSRDQPLADKIENSDSCSALLWGTMATAIIANIMYAMQIVEDGKYVAPKVFAIRSCLIGKHAVATDRENGAGYIRASVDAEASYAGDMSLVRHPLAGGAPGAGKVRSLMTIFEGIESFLYGMEDLFPALVILTLAWATGDIMRDVGTDRLFSQILADGVAAEAVPTLAFVLAVVIALATGSSWSTMMILFPLFIVPAYAVSGGNAIIFNSTVAGILSGSVAGSHMSPISDTTVISSMSCGCQLVNHVFTQAPYSFVVVLLCVLFGTLPIGHTGMPLCACVLLGTVATTGFVFFVGAPITSPTGSYDVITELVLRCHANVNLEELREKTVINYNNEETRENTIENVKRGATENAIDVCV